MKKTPPRGITAGTLSITLIAMAIVLILAVAKIYLSNRIYYKSRHINSLAGEVAALKEENSILRMHVEQLKYKSEITDTIFAMDHEEESAGEEKTDKAGETP